MRSVVFLTAWVFCGLNIKSAVISLLATCHIHSAWTSAVVHFILTVSSSLTARMRQRCCSLFINLQFWNHDPLYGSAVECCLAVPAVINAAGLALLAAACYKEGWGHTGQPGYLSPLFIFSMLGNPLQPPVEWFWLYVGYGWKIKWMERLVSGITTETDTFIKYVNLYGKCVYSTWFYYINW